MGRLTTHVLDLASGKPAKGLRIELWQGTTNLRDMTTNGDGRVDGPVLEGSAFRQGNYELRFHAGDYLKAAGHALPDPPFLDVIPIAFGIADPAAHCHVPLLLSPFGYSTYRGS
jgi:5-hydroxyisourate hydrolase